MKRTVLLMASGWPAEMTRQQKLGYGYLTVMMPSHGGKRGNYQITNFQGCGFER